MKINIWLAVLFLATIFQGCKKDKIEYANDFQKSFSAWTAFKKSSNNSYSYTVVNSSWTGYSTETMLSIVNGQVIGRSFLAKRFQQNSSTFVVLEEWQEDANTLNTHSSGAASLTLDQVYELAKNDFLLKRANATTYFEAQNNGLISSAGYVEDGCQDDCFNGIKISAIIRSDP